MGAHQPERRQHSLKIDQQHCCRTFDGRYKIDTSSSNSAAGVTNVYERGTHLVCGVAEKIGSKESTRSGSNWIYTTPNASTKQHKPRISESVVETRLLIAGERSAARKLSQRVLDLKSRSFTADSSIAAFRCIYSRVCRVDEALDLVLPEEVVIWDRLVFLHSRCLVLCPLGLDSRIN